MKTFLAHLLLFCYFAGLCKPVTPILGDVIGHTFFKLEHISKVHFENGHYHLHQELKEEGKANASPISTNNQNSKETSSFLVVHVIPECLEALLNILLKSEIIFHSLSYILLPGTTGIPEEPPEY